MAELVFPRKPFGETDHVRLISAMARAASGADYDSGWVAASANAVFLHNLGVVPGQVTVMTSSDPTGNSHQPDTYSACTRSQITVAGTLPYTRVRINKGD